MLQNKQSEGEGARSASAWTEWLVWGVAFAIAALLMVAVKVRAVDGDSGLHIGLVNKLSALPMSRWIAPQWWGSWGLEGLYREHPIGILIPPLLLSRLGFPTAQAPFLANAIYQLLTLVIVQRVALAVIPAVKARALGWMLQLIPIAFTYRIRANHEQAVVLLFVMALWAVEKSRKDARWISLLVFSAIATLLVKGVFAVWIFIGCGVWLLIINGSGNGLTIDRFRTQVRRDSRAWIGLLISFAAVLAVIAGYEYLFRQATHESFIAGYLARQIGAAAEAGKASFPIRKMGNIWFYGVRLLWFAFPGSLVVLAVISRRNKREPLPARTRQAFLFSIGVSLLYVVLFSISDRCADRYIFPAYYLLAAGGMIAASYQWDWVQRLVERWDRHYQVLTPLLWLILLCLNLASGPAGLPRMQFN